MFSDRVSPEASGGNWPAGGVIGLEQEYRVLVGDRRVDFRGLLQRAGPRLPSLDPADPNACRLPSGAVLTADEAEAELALAPVLVGPGCALSLAERALRERAMLEALLPGGARLEGYSTHLSVAVDPATRDGMAALYVVTFSAAMMLLLDRTSSPGLLVRPRPRRLELGGEFVAGERLVAAAVFALGSVRACQRLSQGRGRGLEEVGELRVAVAHDDQRYGFFVSREAFGEDLYETGRETPLRLRSGAVISAQDHLECCWEVARPTLVGEVEQFELDLVDGIVSGDEPLPGRATDGRCTLAGGGPPAAGLEAPARAFGRAAGPHSRAGFDIAPVMLTWDRAVFVISEPLRERLAFASVPGPHLSGFMTRLDEGDLDEVIVAYLSARPCGRRLDRRTDEGRAGLYDELAPRRRLLVPERRPTVTGRGTLRRTLRSHRSRRRALKGGRHERHRGW